MLTTEKEMTSLKIELKKSAIEEYLIQHPTASLREIGKLLGVSRQRVHVLMQEMRLKTLRPDTKGTLTYHQLEILRYVGKGYTNRQIAKVIGCSTRSIANQLQTIYTELNVHKRKSAFRLAIEQGLSLTNRSDQKYREIAQYS